MYSLAILKPLLTVLKTFPKAFQLAYVVRMYSLAILKPLLTVLKTFPKAFQLAYVVRMYSLAILKPLLTIFQPPLAILKVLDIGPNFGRESSEHRRQSHQFLGHDSPPYSLTEFSIFLQQ
jgi:hypothetical protein